MGFLIFLFGIGTFIVSTVYIIARTFSGVVLAPGSRQWDNFVRQLRSVTQPLVANLVPWDGKDLLPLLSIGSFSPKKGVFFRRKTRARVVNTIYQEPVIAIADLQLGKTTLMMARTSHNEFVFRIKTKEVEIWVDSQPFAVLTGGALLSSGKNPRLLAQIEPSGDNRQMPIKLGNKTALTIANPATDHISPNPRALLLLRDILPEEEQAVLALTILYQCRPSQ